MSSTRGWAIGVAGVVMLAVVAATAGSGAAQGMGRGMGGGQGMHPGMMDESHMADMQVFHYLLDHRADIRRSVKKLDNGIETLTESAVPEVAAKIKAHVGAMYTRMKDGRPIHQRDPLFREVFRVADRITVAITPTEAGLKVVETSDDAAVVKVLHAHADTVDAFLANGRAEMMKDHPVPK
ncbi:MAG: hypothetical protein AB7H88_01900 [Vicinamibacterales bacterium]